MFNLSGTINVLLFLIIKPELLLFPRPEDLGRPEMELAPQGAANVQHGAEPSTTALVDNAALSRVNSGRILDDDHDI
jgi:hypothetical protein